MTVMTKLADVCVVAGLSLVSSHSAIATADYHKAKPYRAHELAETNSLSTLSQTGSEPGGTFVHLFEWKWSDVSKECTDFLGPAGYAAVQVSPAAEHAVVNPGNDINSYPWYQRYQPVSYKIESRSGTREEFASMVEACNEAGVDVYADAIINHMTGVLADGEQQVGIAGSRFGSYDYPDFSRDNFHRCGTPGNDISNYFNRYEVQNCELVNLADLATDTDYVRDRISTYLADLMSMGVKGFRIDAAKHMNVADIVAIVGQTEEKSGRKPYIFQEVIDQGNGEPIKASEYNIGVNDVTEFKYSLKIGEVFNGGRLHWFNNNQPFGEAWGFLPSSSSVVFTDNHDNQRGHGGGGKVLTHKQPQIYRLANVFMLAWPYGYPKVMSSYAFSNPDQGPPTLDGGKTKSVHTENGINCGKGEWICEHRWFGISQMVKFRKATLGAPLNNWTSNGDNFITFSRGDKGFVGINRQDYFVNKTVQTGLSAGEYCNLLSTDCDTKIIVDDNGMTELKLDAMSAIALLKN